jgi:tetraacyldisaccharide-1-P 4'-kinase
VDGLLQSAPARHHRSLLLLDVTRPWGSGLCPPAGDLRALPRHLLSACDALFSVSEPDLEPGAPLLGGADRVDGADAAVQARLAVARESGERRSIPWHVLRSTLRFVQRGDGRDVPLSDLSGQSVGLLLAVARADRIVTALSARRILPRVTWQFADHAAPTARGLERAAQALGADAPRVWLTTSKCATKVPARIGGAPVLVMEHVVVPSVELISWLGSDCASAPFPAATRVVDCAPCVLPAAQ